MKQSTAENGRVYRVRAVFEVLVVAEDAEDAKETARAELRLHGIESEFQQPEDWLKSFVVSRLTRESAKAEELDALPVQPWTGQHQPTVGEMLGVRKRRRRAGAGKARSHPRMLWGPP